RKYALLQQLFRRAFCKSVGSKPSCSWLISNVSNNNSTPCLIRTIYILFFFNFIFFRTSNSTGPENTFFKIVKIRLAIAALSVCISNIVCGEILDNTPFIRIIAANSAFKQQVSSSIKISSFLISEVKDNFIHPLIFELLLVHIIFPLKQLYYGESFHVCHLVYLLQLLLDGASPNGSVYTLPVQNLLHCIYITFLDRLAYYER